MCIMLQICVIWERSVMGFTVDGGFLTKTLTEKEYLWCHFKKKSEVFWVNTNHLCCFLATNYFFHIYIYTHILYSYISRNTFFFCLWIWLKWRKDYLKDNKMDKNSETIGREVFILFIHVSMETQFYVS